MSRRSLLPLLFPLAMACTPVATKVAHKPRPNLALLDERGTFLPPPLDGARLLAKNVELWLPRGCLPLDVPSFVHVASLVNDADSDLLAACNVMSEQGTAKVTIVLIRHRIRLETGESAAAELRRAPGVIDVLTTTAGPTAGNALGPEVVLSTNVPTGPKARPSASVFFGAADGLYVLYAEVDGDLKSLGAWGDAMTATLRPTPSARPIRWRAPTRLAPSATAFGEHRLHLPEGVDAVPKGTKTLGVLVGDAHDPLDVREANAMVHLRDDASIALSGTIYRAKTLPGVADTPAQVAKMSAEARFVLGLESRRVVAPIGDVVRIDGTRADGHHEVYAALPSGGPEITVLRLVVTADKWAAYEPFVDAMLASIEKAPASEPY